MNNRDPENAISGLFRNGSTVATILILDNDLGFAFWLGMTLTAPHCAAFPAQSVGEASALISAFNLKIDFLIMNPAVPGASEFTHALRAEHSLMRVATLTDALSRDTVRDPRSVPDRKN